MITTETIGGQNNFTTKSDIKEIIYFFFLVIN